MNGKSAPLLAKLSEISSAEGDPSRDDILAGFLDYVADLGLDLYPAQEEAILELLDWKHVILSTPTGSGKSLVAFALFFQALAEGRVSYYTCPIKALVNEKFFDLSEAFGPENVGLLTGDASVNREAPIICCTAEILSNMALRNEKLDVDYVVMDEFHFYGDRERGAAWQIPLISMKDTLFLMMSATLGDTSHIETRLTEYTDREVAAVTGSERPVPLEFGYRVTPLQETIEELLESDEAPIYLVNFTQRACAEQAQGLTSVNMLSKEEKRAVAAELKEARLDTPYGAELRRFLRAGIGVHHAGLLPRYRLLVEKLSQAGLLKVVSGTDSLGVGVNIPIRTVIFRGLSKFDGEKTRLVSARQFHQIAGRAGRKGFDDRGRVVVQAPEHVIENKRIELKLAGSPHLKNKLKRKRAPSRGYVHWDESVFDRLVSSPPEPLEPRFEVTHGMLVNVIGDETDAPGGGYKRLMKMIGRSHLSSGAQRRQRRRAAALIKSLVRAELVELVPRGGGRPGSRLALVGGLQERFSLNRSLSLFLVEALDLLDPEGEEYALDALSLVEAILEDPKAVLFRQLDRLKGELIGRLKAEGVPYDERMEELEKVDYPRPLADLLEEAFEAFVPHHPWLEGESLRPKSVAREMYERCFGFEDYVRELGLARSEGVLLRYLSQAYKIAVQNVPEGRWDEQFGEILAYFHTMLKIVDSSLLDEWERMMGGEAARPTRELPEARPERAPELWEDPRALAARVRGELHLLLGALADRRYEDACLRVRRTEHNEWDPDRFAAALAPYFEEHAAIDVTPRARQPIHTFIVEEEPRRFAVQHKIIDPEGEEDWALHCSVDLTGEVDLTAPIVELERIGV